MHITLHKRVGPYTLFYRLYLTSKGERQGNWRSFIRCKIWVHMPSLPSKGCGCFWTKQWSCPTHAGKVLCLLRCLGGNHHLMPGLELVDEQSIGQFCSLWVFPFSRTQMKPLSYWWKMLWATALCKKLASKSPSHTANGIGWCCINWMGANEARM